MRADHFSRHLLKREDLSPRIDSARKGSSQMKNSGSMLMLADLASAKNTASIDNGSVDSKERLPPKPDLKDSKGESCAKRTRRMTSTSGMSSGGVGHSTEVKTMMRTGSHSKILANLSRNFPEFKDDGFQSKRSASGLKLSQQSSPTDAHKMYYKAKDSLQ